MLPSAAGRGDGWLSTRGKLLGDVWAGGRGARGAHVLGGLIHPL